MLQVYAINTVLLYYIKIRLPFKLFSFGNQVLTDRNKSHITFFPQFLHTIYGTHSIDDFLFSTWLNSFIAQLLSVSHWRCNNILTVSKMFYEQFEQQDRISPHEKDILVYLYVRYVNLTTLACISKEQNRTIDDRSILVLLYNMGVLIRDNAELKIQFMFETVHTQT